MEKNKVMMIVIIVLLVVLLATIVGVFFYTLQIIKTNNTNQSEVTADSLVQEMPKLSVNELTTINLSDAISTNLRTSDNGEEHIIRLNVGVRINNTDEKESPLLQALMESNNSLNMDLVLSVLRNKTYEELKQPDGDEKLKEELLTQFRETYESNLIYSVVISNIIFQ